MKRLRQMTRMAPATLALAAAALGLASLCASQLWSGSRTASILAAAPLRIDIAEEPWPERQSPDLEVLQASALFHQSRTHYVPPSEPVIVAPPPDYKLGGVMLAPGKPRAAFLTQAAGGARVKVSEGELLEGWTVASIHPQVVVLQQGEQTVEIRSASRAANAQQSVAPRVGPPAQPFSGGVRVLGQAPQSAPRIPAMPNDTGARLFQPPK